MWVRLIPSRHGPLKIQHSNHTPCTMLTTKVVHATAAIARQSADTRLIEAKCAELSSKRVGVWPKSMFREGERIWWPSP
jgi:hypothetical protein